MPAFFLALANLLPAILRLGGKDSAAEVVDQGVALAKKLTGQEEPNAALEAVKANPQLLLQFQQTMNDVVIHELDEETKRLQAVNETMRTEINSGDPFVRRARPSFIWSMSITWSIQMLCISAAVVMYPDKAGPLITACAGLTGMWAVALAVIGVYFKARSDDKKLAAGVDAPSMLESLSGMLQKK